MDNTGKLENLSDWGYNIPSLRNDVAALLVQNLKPDFYFFVGKYKKPILTHLNVMAISSSLFKKITSDFVNKGIYQIQIPNVEEVGFSNLMTFFYSNENVLLNLENVIPTLDCARKFQIIELERQCLVYLNDNINSKNAIGILNLAISFNSDFLRLNCLHIIDSDTNSCMASDTFPEIDNYTLETILKRDSLTIKEIDLYNAVLRWAQAECSRQELDLCYGNMRKVLKHCADLIRYPIMLKEEFKEGPARDCLLSDEQKVEIFNYFNLQRKCKFSNVSRKS